jgi:hypothetical protein
MLRNRIAVGPCFSKRSGAIGVGAATDGREDKIDPRGRRIRVEALKPDRVKTDLIGMKRWTSVPVEVPTTDDGFKPDSRPTEIGGEQNLPSIDDRARRIRTDFRRHRFHKNLRDGYAAFASDTKPPQLAGPGAVRGNDRFRTSKCDRIAARGA